MKGLAASDDVIAFKRPVGLLSGTKLVVDKVNASGNLCGCCIADDDIAALLFYLPD